MITTEQQRILKAQLDQLSKHKNCTARVDVYGLATSGTTRREPTTTFTLTVKDKNKTTITRYSDKDIDVAFKELSFQLQKLIIMI